VKLLLLVKKIKEKGINLVCLLSPWPETFSFVLSEIWAAGIPVVVTPFGAPAERVSQSKGGIVLEDLDVEKFVNVVSEIAESPEKYKSLVDNTKNIHVKSISEMLEDYDGLYLSMAKEQILIEDVKIKNQLLQNILKMSAIIQGKEGVEQSTFSFQVTNPVGYLGRGQQTLTAETWRALGAIFPDTKLGKYVKIVSGGYIYASNYGIVSALKRFWKMIKKDEHGAFPY